MPKTYDQAYFDKWYRDPAHAVGAPAALRRKVALAVAQAEYYLGRPLRNVLDVGCGEAPWRAPLRALRPGVDYRGLDASQYVVARYGRSRNIGLARFGQLEHLRFDTRFDLIVCSDVLHYLKPAEIRAGLAGIAGMAEGVAFLEVFTSRDGVDGDLEGFHARAPEWYLRAFADAGLLPCGSHCYLAPRLGRRIAALELARLPAGTAR
ncbi:class I SAM-dependent DNA methyltransferase [Fulvimonas soli]|jgi:SAM-dependent methyltransferase|uniref:Methyltransferase family protein n=1 Tax=Fulvimonas soli TaxID=155197 RepID=A0A316IIG4_9GAMM|nr:class I SAM-dependent methyltransferase [Fulvimonas soli]PWK92700.1 methyltransferase family protein [Fulvimonas soli]TNY27131.1 methyltransferase [Fulvimonas soli]